MTDNLYDRRSEWFVPKFGPTRFRLIAGLLFLPYTGMVLSFTVIGSILAVPIHYDRVLAIVVIYFLGLGLGAHALDALGSQGLKPWGRVLKRSHLWIMAISSLALAYLIATYYIVRYAPLLAVIAVLEGFFVFAYNLEWFHGRFHTDGWFAFSWGFLPVLAGTLIQTNRISMGAMALGVSMGLFSLVEIKASRPYRSLRKVLNPSPEEHDLVMRYEAILKGISLGVMLLGGGLLLWRMGR